LEVTDPKPRHQIRTPPARKEVRLIRLGTDTASTVSVGEISDAFSKTDTRLRQLLKALKEKGAESDEFKEAVSRARRRARDNRALLD
jgi:hypothetical protein